MEPTNLSGPEHISSEVSSGGAQRPARTEPGAEGRVQRPKAAGKSVAGVLRNISTLTAEGSG